MFENWTISHTLQLVIAVLLAGLVVAVVTIGTSATSLLSAQLKIALDEQSLRAAQAAESEAERLAKARLQTFLNEAQARAQQQQQPAPPLKLLPEH
uniref:hypothetical protein n=1 Tax=Burkholderia arboris TaxID=488730 RepID=UPI003BEF332E